MFSLLLAIVACSKDEVKKPALSVLPKAIEADANGKTQEIKVTSNGKWTVKSNAAEWCVVTPTSGENNGVFNVEIKPNETLASRETTVVVKSETLEQTIEVTQDAASREAVLSGSKWELESQSGEDGYDDLIGALINLNDDKTANVVLDIVIEEVPIDKVNGTWKLDKYNLIIEGKAAALDMDITVVLAIKEMNDEIIVCDMKVEMLLPPTGVPITLKRVK